MHAKETFQAAIRLLLNKAAAIVALLLLANFYLGLPNDPEKALPFVELLYFGIVAGTAIVVAPVVRLLMFPEAAEYAENGKLREDIRQPFFTPGLVHYWYATSLSYLIPTLCIALSLRL